MNISKELMFLLCVFAGYGLSSFIIDTKRSLSFASFQIFKKSLTKNKITMKKNISNEKQNEQSCKTDVTPCFSEKEIKRINKYATHQYNRCKIDLPLVSFEDWVNKE